MTSKAISNGDKGTRAPSTELQRIFNQFESSAKFVPALLPIFEKGYKALPNCPVAIGLYALSLSANHRHRDALKILGSTDKTTQTQPHLHKIIKDITGEYYIEKNNRAGIGVLYKNNLKLANLAQARIDFNEGKYQDASDRIEPYIQSNDSLTPHLIAIYCVGRDLGYTGATGQEALDDLLDRPAKDILKLARDYAMKKREDNSHGYARSTFGITNGPCYGGLRL